MKKYILSVIASLFLIIPKVSAQDQDGLFSLGGSLSYGSFIESVGLGLRAQYGFTDYIRGSAEYKYYIDRRDWSSWEVNADLHYVIEASRTFSIYPLAGLKVSRWTVDSGRNSAVSEIDHYKESTNRLGLNLGLGLQFELSNNVFFLLEPKYEFTKNYSQFVGQAGIIYQF